MEDLSVPDELRSSKLYVHGARRGGASRQAQRAVYTYALVRLMLAAELRSKSNGMLINGGADTRSALVLAGHGGAG